jgi:hypothetical protein
MVVVSRIQMTVVLLHSDIVVVHCPNSCENGIFNQRERERDSVSLLWCHVVVTSVTRVRMTRGRSRTRFLVVFAASVATLTATIILATSLVLWNAGGRKGERERE